METENPIKEARQKLGMSQAELANELGVKQPTVCRWERGKVKRIGQLERQAIEKLLAERGAAA